MINPETITREFKTDENGFIHIPEANYVLKVYLHKEEDSSLRFNYLNPKRTLWVPEIVNTAVTVEYIPYG